MKARSPWRWIYDSREWALLRDQVLSEEPFCRCGCGGIPTVVDHIRDHKGDHSLAFDRANLRALTKRCHDRKTAQTALRPGDEGGQLAPVTLVAGPPCSGKTTRALELASPGDLVVDWDRLAEALGSGHSHDHPSSLRPFLLEAREALLARLQRPSSIGHAYVTTTLHHPLSLVPNANVIRMDTSEEECIRRAIASNRPRRWLDLIAEWHITARALDL